MSSEYGVNVETSSSAAQVLKTATTTTIAFVGTGTTAGLTLHSSVSEAKAALETGTIKENFELFEMQNSNGPVLFSTAVAGDTAAKTKTAVIAAINALKNAGATLATVPDLIIAPGHSHEADVQAALASVAESLKCICIADLNANSESTAKTAVANLVHKRMVACWPQVKYHSVFANATVTKGLSPAYAGLIAKTDGASEYGYSDSPSNRLINGITATEYPVEYLPGEDSLADRLRKERIATVINYQGFRSWGGETRTTDTTWQDLPRLRIFDRVAKAALDGLFFAIDKKAKNILPIVKDTVESLLRRLQGADVLIGFEVSWDSAQNTPANIAAGKIYLTASMQNNPIVKRLEVKFNYNDKWGETIFTEST